MYASNRIRSVGFRSCAFAVLGGQSGRVRRSVFVPAARRRARNLAEVDGNILGGRPVRRHAVRVGVSDCRLQRAPAVSPWLRAPANVPYIPLRRPRSATALAPLCALLESV